jgi:hypothetical protein
MARLGRQTLAALGATTRNNLLAILGRHASAEAVTARAHELAGLKCPLHDQAPVDNNSVSANVSIRE